MIRYPRVRVTDGPPAYAILYAIERIAVHGGGAPGGLHKPCQGIAHERA
jgi:hypothetical protein